MPLPRESLRVAIEIKALNKNKSNSNKLQLLYDLKYYSHTKGLTSSNFISCGSGAISTLLPDAVFWKIENG